MCFACVCVNVCVCVVCSVVCAVCVCCVCSVQCVFVIWRAQGLRHKSEREQQSVNSRA